MTDGAEKGHYIQMSDISFLRGVPANEALDEVKDGVAEAYADALSKFGSAVLQYTTPGLADFNGFVPLKETLAKRYGVSGEAGKRVICFNGGMEVFSLLLKSFPRGSRVAVEAMTYDRALSDALRYDHDVIGIPFTAEGIDLDVLETELKAGDLKLFYRVIYHQNPTGLDSTFENIEAAAELCAEHNALYICDIAYYELRYDGQDNPGLDLAKHPTTSLIGSFTKTISPGTKCGFGIFPEKVVEMMTPVIANTRLNPNYPTQAMIHMFIESGSYDKYLDYLTGLYKPRMDALNAALAANLPECEAPHLTGGFFAGLWFRGVEEDAFIGKAKDNGVNVASSKVFAPSMAEKYAQEKNGPFIRLTFPAVDPESITEGVKRLKKTYDQLKG